MVIDANVFCSVFNPSSKDHYEFAPVLNWITKGAGFVVYGGTKYKQELANAPRYQKIFIELNNKGKTREVNCRLVDQDQKIVASLAKGTCDDQHIIAIFRVSGCHLFCSNDARSYKHIKDSKLYLKNQKHPLIYHKRKHSNMLCVRNIVSIRNVV
jgi:hypothetical protein